MFRNNSSDTASIEAMVKVVRLECSNRNLVHRRGEWSLAAKTILSHGDGDCTDGLYV